MSLYRKLVNIDYRIHLLISIAVRLVLICYGAYVDETFFIQYTDVDYKVFTDASRHVLNGGSPYDRHTFRYSPIIAILLVPNVLIGPLFGKVLFSVFDILVALLIRSIVLYTVKEYERNLKKPDGKEIRSVEWHKTRKNKRRQSEKVVSVNDEIDGVWANLSMLVWLYNPLTIAISTRGNCDSLACFLVLSTLYLIQCKKWCFLAGLMHGFSVHFRLYPLIYSLTYYMFLSRYSVYSTEDRVMKVIKTLQEQKLTRNRRKAVKYTEKRTVFTRKYLLYLLPNVDQVKFVSGCVSSMLFFTVLFYKLYGQQFLYETYIYHLIRKDTRHNFSLYFYLQYLTAGVKNIGLWQKVLTGLPPLILLLVFSFRYGLNKFALSFGLLTQTIVMVTYNGVLTSQYFVWIMGVLPLCLWQIQMPLKTVVYMLLSWFAAQGAWLMAAFWLEFLGENTFFMIWLQCVSFFCLNIVTLARVIRYFAAPKQKVE